MKPLYVGLLVLAATVVIGIAVIETRIPKPAAPALLIPQAVATPAPVAEVPTPPPPARAHRKRTTANRAFTKQTQASDERLGDNQTGGIFSGADPKDPRIYHFAD